ncbi:23S rRNA (uracil(1939)-C(5))-methyltransferase RlmD [Litchfieldella xinjiangensis]|uniref:23S rRNA (uracil(1939)-C(5))-methyltransferase RlmD n=1 Tax=Litchfieldella xinjiangensis TaxID=1166948 RepID=UPI0005B7BE8B|nr:23S rRNA (uracil(1939)-C(5))-methyltransferase RlmD [Halomonas xinjiangensis]
MAMLGKRRPPRTAQNRLRRESSPQAKQSGEGADDGTDVEILRLAHDGRGVAKDASGKTVFVERTLPGERVDIAVHRSRKRFDEAHPREILVASPQRVAPVCDHFGLCGGCDIQHQALDAQRRHKRDVLTDHLARQGMELLAAPEMLAGEGTGYRRRARLGVKVDAQGEVHLGFRSRDSHHLVDILHCPVIDVSLESLLGALRQLLAGLDAPRQVGHLELVIGQQSRVVVVRQLRDSPADAARWRAFADDQGVHVAWMLGRETPALSWLGDEPSLEYSLTVGAQELSLGFAPGDFLQVNGEINQRLVDTALAWLAPVGNEYVLDLFAGVGNFSLALAPRVSRVSGIEGNPAMVERLQANARRNGLDNVEAHQANLNAPDEWDPLTGSHPDVVILDPPREGAERVCHWLANAAVPRILYVSCDPATLARDASHLVQAGYRIERAAMADMFPQTAHLESMLLFVHHGTRNTQGGAPAHG